MPAPTPPGIRPDITSYADPITAVYEDVTDRLMVNIARHFNSNRPAAGTLEWQFQKLAELGRLNEESIRIIAERTGQVPELLSIALSSAANAAIKGVEPHLEAAAARGFLLSPASSVSATVLRVLDAYQNQALDKLNLVNTVMLESTKDAYRGVVNNTVLYAQMEEAQQVLNNATGAVITGAQSRQTALRTAVKQMSAAGIAGFVDRAGHKWTAEAYVNMDVRTTAGNVATEVTFARNADYGNDLIWVPVLSAARPGCFPYQKAVLSTNNRSGKVEDLDGSMIEFFALSSTTYGEPAGLFGINCHHTPPNIFIPGLSKLRGQAPSEEANTKDYALSQEQRKHERKLREAKREAAIADAMGDKEAFDKASLKVKRAKVEHDDFIKKTGRTQRLDRTQVYGYDRSVAGKVTQSARRQQNKALVRNIDLDDLSGITYGTGMRQEVVDAIGATVKELEKKCGFTYSYVSKQIVSTDGCGTPIFQTQPIVYGKGSVLLQLNINTERLSGMSVADIDSMFSAANMTVANTLSEALIHEAGHAKLISGRTRHDISELYATLKNKGVKGISDTAYTDGAEAIAEIHVLKARGTAITEEAQALYNAYMQKG